MLLIVGARFNGASFLDFNENVSSLIMALLFAAAARCYIALIYRLPLIESAHSRPPRVASCASPEPAFADNLPGGC